MPTDKLTSELAIINSLLRSEAYAYEMAKALNAGDDSGQPKEFINDGDDTAIVRSLKDEKIATSIAAFYALECGTGLLCEQTKQTPVEWLRKIVDKTVDEGAILLLNRFANATWKAGQPFRNLSRITRYNFTGASYLTHQEIKKDHDQVLAAATLLLEHMRTVEDSPLPEQMNQLKTLLQDIAFAGLMAKHLHSSYHIDLHQPVPLFLSPDDDTTMIQKSASEQKVATSIAGFYALECGINYLVTIRALVPTDILRSILDNSIDEFNKTLFLRLANATWKAGQPFRDIKRLTRHTFTPAYFLTEDDIEKDMYQIKTAARKLLQTIEAIQDKTN